MKSNNGKTAVFIFRRDLRLSDNTALKYAIDNYEFVEPIFFLIDEQIGSKNKYKSQKCIDFMMESLSQMKVSVIKVESYKDIPRYLEKTYDFDAILFNKDYTEYAIERDTYLEKYCQSCGKDFISLNDQLLLGDFHFVKDSVPFSKFTYFYNKTHSLLEGIKVIKQVKLKGLNKNILKRKQVFEILKKFNGSKYDNGSNLLPIKTTGISQYLKFGIVSPREIYLFFKSHNYSEPLIRQLLWRDFYYTFYFFNISLKLKEIPWNTNLGYFNKWAKGQTGVPVIDACMRNLNSTGLLHNRGRLIVASFLAKNLMVDWKLGEKYFSQNLLDIDRIQNMAGWHSVVGVAPHSLPYFRVFNPYIQSKKYDPQCIFIKQWVPELCDVPIADIHDWENKYQNYNGYIKPIVNYSESKEKYLSFFKK